MYITTNDVIGEKTIDLSYPIHPTAGWGREIAIVSRHISNSQVLLHRSIEVLLKTGKKIVLNKGVYTDKLGAKFTDRNGAEITNAGFL